MSINYVMYDFLPMALVIAPTCFICLMCRTPAEHFYSLIYSIINMHHGRCFPVDALIVATRICTLLKRYYVRQMNCTRPNICCRKFLANYFGEVYDPSMCNGFCDHCIRRAPPPPPPPPSLRHRQRQRLRADWLRQLIMPTDCAFCLRQLIARIYSHLGYITIMQIVYIT